MSEEAGRGGDVVFREVQRFTQWWIYALTAVAAGFVWYIFLYQVVLGRVPEEDRAPDWFILLIWLVVGLGVPLLIITSRLVVEVRRDGLYFRYHPFHRALHRIAFEDIAEVEARAYKPIREFGGWGIRYAKGGKAYNVRGDRGVQLELGDGRRILFGSQQAEEFASAVRQALPNKT